MKNLNSKVVETGEQNLMKKNKNKNKQKMMDRSTKLLMVIEHKKATTRYCKFEENFSSMIQQLSKEQFHE